jgi:uncharacterized 2Fe-2S/4Fe-4S cluster protein (DUF4445 family)
MNSKKSSGRKLITDKVSMGGCHIEIVYACNRNGMDALNKAVIGNIGDLVQNLARENRIELDEISGHGGWQYHDDHLLLRMEPCLFAQSPYPNSSVPVMKASDVVPINPDGLLGVMPCVSSYGEISRRVLASGMGDSSKISMLMDLRTNGEIVVGNNEWLVCCSASVGPARRGLKCGMRATQGAIQTVSISNDHVNYSTIGNVKPYGICGSGVIDVMSELFKNKWIQPDGKFNAEKANSRVRETVEGQEFIIARAGESEEERML